MLVVPSPIKPCHCALDGDFVVVKHRGTGGRSEDLRRGYVLCGEKGAIHSRSNQCVSSIRFQMELCSEAPHYNERWPSDIRFHVNNHYVGYWSCSGDFGDRKGVLTPDWWDYGTQYGMLKTLMINEDGTFIDGSPISGITIDVLEIAYGKPISFKIESARDAENAGGFCLFGRGFGNYDQGISVSIEYQSSVK